MTRERKKTPRLRLFLALDLPEEVKDEIVDWRQDVFGDMSALRMTSRDSLHVTLVFLGYQAEKYLPQIVESAFAGFDPGEGPILRFDEAQAVPRGRPRLYALNLEDRSGAVTRMQQGFVGRLCDSGFRRPEKRPFWAHVTVARIRRKSGDERVGSEIRGISTPLPERLRVPFNPVRIGLYSSLLRPEGAVYQLLAHRELPNEKQ